MNIFVCSDNHFNHFMINKYCNRGFKSLEEMNGTMIWKWNCTVKPDDLVINLGDIIFTKGESQNIKDIFAQLNGNIVLVQGNHDKKSIHFYLEAGIKFVCNNFQLYYGGRKLFFIHDPKRLDKKIIKKYDYVIHGHRHEKGEFKTYIQNTKFLNVCPEQIGYYPVLLNKILDKNYKGNKI